MSLQSLTNQKIHADLIQDGQGVQSMPSFTSLSTSKVQEDTEEGKCFCIPHHTTGFLSNILVKFQKQHEKDKELNRGNMSLVLMEDLKKRTQLLEAAQRQHTMHDIVSHRRLILVLDLDHTLLHSSPSYNRQVDNRIRNHNCHYNGNKIHSADLFVVNYLALVTKLRPHARAFLEALHPMYDLYVYTMRNRTYATTMALLLDPEGCLLGNKVRCREDSTMKGTKALDVIPGPPEAIVVIDDTMDVWHHKEDQERVINIKRYCYSGFCDAGGSKRKEEEEDTDLLSLLTILKKIHSGFFTFYSDDQQKRCQELWDEQNMENSNNDVSVLLRNIQSTILHGCCIVFGDIFPMAAKAEREAAWMLAQRLGASCSIELDVEVTHVIAKTQNTREACWAAANNKFLVTPEWLDEAFYSWTRPLEEKFPVRHAVSNATILRRYLLK